MQFSYWILPVKDAYKCQERYTVGACVVVTKHSGSYISPGDSMLDIVVPDKRLSLCFADFGHTRWAWFLITE